MSEHEHSALFGTPLPDSSRITPGQQWTAALAILLAALLLNAGGPATLVGQRPPVPASATAPSRSAPRSSLEGTPTSPPATGMPSPAFGDVPPTSEPEGLPPSTTPSDEAPPDDSGSEPPDGGGSASPSCATPLAPVLAGAGLCPPG